MNRAALPLPIDSEEGFMAAPAHEPGAVVDRNLALELVRVTEAAALAASRWIGRGDKNAADGAAVEAMRKAFDTVAIAGTVVIGEGEMDEAPMLYIGEKVGLYARTGGGLEVDIAVDPLEGTSITAKGGPNAIATVALAEKGGFLHAPDIYMDKIAVGPGLPDGVVSLDASPEQNLRELAKAKKVDVSDLMVCTLDRDRHKDLIKACRAAGARITLIGDGDVSGVMNVAQPEAGIDIYMGSGGAPEGVLAAAALRCTGGQMYGRLMFETEEQIARARAMGVTDPNRIYAVDEMAKGDVMFAATGVTTGAMLRGVRRYAGGAYTHSIVMRSKSGTVRYVEGHHNFARKPSAFLA
jgi:fructose-1,6-bisphosphatase II / sedoheptulose-1,7-bisphosphatase